MKRRARKLRGAHACGVLVSAFCRNDLSDACDKLPRQRQKFAMFWRTSPARWKRALPGLLRDAFTLIELLIVMSIIIVLAGLVIATSGYVQEKSKRSRTEAEIAAMSAALESYKADNGIYPTNPATEMLNPSTALPATYDPAGKFLYGELTGDRDWDGVTNPNDKSYMTFKPASLQRANMSLPVSTTNKVTGVRDPFGTLYGYSTLKAAATNPGTVGGYNPTFDLWSTAGTSGTSASDQAKWIKNW